MFQVPFLAQAAIVCQSKVWVFAIPALSRFIWLLMGQRYLVVLGQSN